MAKKKITDQELYDELKRFGVEGVARKFSMNRRTVQRRKRELEAECGPISPPKALVLPTDRPARIQLSLKSGLILVGSDAHYWPGPKSTAHRAFVRLAEDLQPDVIVQNGDVIDAASISRHAPIGWENQPTVKDEMDVAQERLAEIEAASPDSQRFWTLGNHDARFETRLASVAPEFRDIHGIHLKDHFPRWQPSWSVDVNQTLIIKHRFKGGTHAAWNNVLYAGRSICTGHLHALQVKPHTDYNGTRWGVDCGTLADPLGPQFTGYTEDNPLNWRSGFVLFRFEDGELRWPETIPVVKPGVVQFRGKDMEV